MKKLVYFFSLASLLATVSCKDDDAATPAPASQNKITYNGQTYNAKSGAIVDYGALDANDDEVADFFNYDFYISDATYVKEGDDYDVEGNQTFILYAEMFANSATSFKTGTHKYVFNDDVEDEDNIFPVAQFFVDKNNNGSAQDELADDEFTEVIGGTIEVSGANNNYTLVFDLTLEGNKKLKGSYSGNFVYIEFSEIWTEENARLNLKSAGKLKMK